MNSYEERPDLDDRLGAHVPWDFFLTDNGIWRNKDGSISRTIEMHGRDWDSAEDRELLTAVNRVAGLMGQFTTRWAHHLEVSRRKVTRYPSWRPENPVARMTDEERAGRFTSGEHFVSRYFDTVTLSPPPAAIQKLRRFFTKGKITKRGMDVIKELVLPFDKTTRLYADLLNDAMSWARILTPDETVTYMHSVVSPHAGRPVRATPEQGWPIERDVFDTDFVKGSLPLAVDYQANWHLRTIGILGYPEISYPGVLEALNSLNIEYRLVYRFLCLSTYDAGEVFRKIFQKRKDNKYAWGEYLKSRFWDRTKPPEEDAVEVRHALEAQAARIDAEFSGAQSGYFCPTVTVWDRDLDEVNRMCEEVMKAFRGKRFNANVETFNAWNTWRSSVPGEIRANAREIPVPTIHPANMFPISSPGHGPSRNERLKGPCIGVMETAGCEIYNFDFHYFDTGNAVIIAPVRTGKSTLLAWSAVQFQRYKDFQIFSLDVDAEFSAIAPACMLTGGDVMSFESNRFALQPFRHVDDPEQFRIWRDWAMTVLEAQEIIGAAAKSKLSNAEAKRLVTDALRTVRAQKDPNLRDMDLFQAALQHDELKLGFDDYCGKGIYASYVNAKEDRFSGARWVTFELTALANKPKAIRPILVALLNKIWERLDGRPTMIQIDEAWLALREMPEQLDEMLRRFPKRNAFLVFACHSLHDIADSKIHAILKDNCKTKIFLSNSQATSEEGERVLRAFGYNGQQCKLIADLVPKVDVYVTRPDGARPCQLRLGEVERLVVAAGGEADARLFNELRSKHDRHDLPAAYFRAKGRPDIADELERGGAKDGVSGRLAA